MRAVAVRPRKPGSVHLAELPEPSLADFNGRGVKVRVLKCGVDATDREINEGLYGDAPPGYDFLVIGHEVFGRVEEVGERVAHVQPGDYVACTVRRPGGSIYDQIGRSDITSEETYYERGICLLHGFMTEAFVDDAEFIVRVPPGLKHLHVLSEPMSVAAKAVQQAFDAQRRLQVWEPQRAFVLGAGQIGLLTTLTLRLLGLEVYTLSRSPKPVLKAEIAEQLGATYVSTRETSLAQLAAEVGKADLIVEATGSSRVAFSAMEVLNLNGALVWTSVTGGDETVDVPADKLNLEWVLGNKLLVGSVNSNRNHFEMGLSDLALAEVTYPGVIERILTHPVDGLQSYGRMMELLESSDPLKVFVNVADE